MVDHTVKFGPSYLLNFVGKVSSNSISFQTSGLKYFVKKIVKI